MLGPQIKYCFISHACKNKYESQASKAVSRWLFVFCFALPSSSVRDFLPCGPAWLLKHLLSCHSVASGEEEGHISPPLRAPCRSYTWHLCLDPLSQNAVTQLWTHTPGCKGVWKMWSCGKGWDNGTYVVNRKREKTDIGGLSAAERMEKRKIDCDPPFVLEYLMFTCTRTGILEQMC